MGASHEVVGDSYSLLYAVDTGEIEATVSDSVGTSNLVHTLCYNEGVSVSDWSSYWVDFDCGEQYKYLYSYYLGGDDDTSNCPTAWALYGSNDSGKTWGTLDVQTGQSPPAGLYDLEEAGFYKKYRVVFSDGAYSNGSGLLRGIELFVYDAETTYTSEPGISKVVLGGEVLIDLTADTVTADTLAKGVTAHDKTGAQITGTLEGGNASKYGATVDAFLGGVDSNGVLQAPAVEVDLVFDGVTDIANRALDCFSNQVNRKIKSVSFPDLTSITGLDALYAAFWLPGTPSSLETISFPKLVSITGERALYAMARGFRGTDVEFPALVSIKGDYCFQYAFAEAPNVQSIQFPELVTIEGTNTFTRAFYDISSITSVSFPKLTRIGREEETNDTDRSQFGFAFYFSTVKTLEFPALEKIYCTDTSSACGTFQYNGSIKEMYFPKLTTIAPNPNYTGSNASRLVAHMYIFSECNQLTEIHFGAANQEAIEASDGYATLWGRGAGEATVYFDL